MIRHLRLFVVLLLMVPIQGQNTQTDTTQPTSTAETATDSTTDTTTGARPRPATHDSKTIAPPKVVKAPDTGPLNLYASLSHRVIGVGHTPIKRFDVAIGAKAHPTPQGLFAIQHIVWDPGWHPPNAAWAKGKQPTAPGDPDNPMKVVKLFFQEPD